MKMKKLVTVLTVVSILGVAGVAFAATIKTPAEITSALTGKSVTQVNEERADGKTYGTIAKEAGKLDEFQTQMLAQRKAVLDQRVKDGSLTQAQADEIYNRIKTNQTNCNGTGLGQGACGGAGFGQGACGGAGGGMGCGQGTGGGFGGGARAGRGI